MGYPLLFSMQWVQRLASWRFRHEFSWIMRAKPPGAVRSRVWENVCFGFSLESGRCKVSPYW